MQVENRKSKSNGQECVRNLKRARLTSIMNGCFPLTHPQIWTSSFSLIQILVEPEIQTTGESESIAADHN